MKNYNVCWSGGLDSTLVVVQLSRFPVNIRPFYVKGQTYRQSEPQELKAISVIREMLLQDSRTKANIEPINIIEQNDPRTKERSIVQAHRHIYMRQLKKYKDAKHGKLPPVGSHQTYIDGGYISQQYIACASLAKHFGDAVELGLVCNDSEADIVRQAATQTEKDDITEREILCLRATDTADDVAMLFKDCRFPLLGQEMYKKDVWQWYSEHGYTDIRSQTNSCQYPIVNSDGTTELCGVCNPCITLIRGGVLAPFTQGALERYRDYEENHEKEPERFRMKKF